MPWKFFGANWMSYVLLGGAMSFIGCAMLTRIATRHFGAHAKWPALLFAIVYFNFNFAVFGGFQLETIQSFFTILAAGAALEWLRDRDWRDALLLGLASGCAAMCKPTGIAVVGACAIAFILSNRRLSWNITRHAAALAAGFLFPGIVVVAHLLHTDTLKDMPVLAQQISAYAANSSWDAVDWTKPLTILILGGFPLFVRGAIFRREKDRLSAQIDRAPFTFVLAWLILETIGVVAQRRMYAYHFLVLVPPLTLLYAMLPRQVRVKPLGMSLIPTAIFSIYGASLVLEICYTGQQKSEVGAYVSARSSSADSVWKDDAAKLWLETGCRPATRFPITFLFANYDDAPIEYVAQMLGDFSRTRPKYIVLPAQRARMVKHQSDHIVELARFPRRRENFQIAWQKIFDYVDRRYVLETRIGNDAIYRLRTDEPGVARVE
ncbi:MAG: glycosyltransferase family 39 protein [Anaerolineae bacterium]|nr:glycosyltransferase family 39 protein [Phycisphaerae bacterium]